MKKESVNPIKLTDEIKTAFKSFGQKDRGFDCLNCGMYFVPADGQWIFDNLCDKCFGEFKNCGRKVNEKYGRFAHAKDWIKWKRKKWWQFWIF